MSIGKGTVVWGSIAFPGDTNVSVLLDHEAQSREMLEVRLQS